MALVRSAFPLGPAPPAGRTRLCRGAGSLGGSFGETFAGFDRRRVARYVADQAVLLRRGNQGFVHKLRQLHLGESGEGAGEGGLVRHLTRGFPSANAPQLRILMQSLE